MPIVNDVAVDWDALRGRLASADEAASRPRAWLRTLDSALAEAAALVQPAIAYSVQPVVGASAGRLIVGDGTPLESPVVAALFGGAPDVVPMVFTIGPLLEARVAEHSAANDPARAFALDLVGSLAVDDVGRVGFGLIERMARDRRLEASIPLNPGTSHWPMSGQRVIAELTGASEIGVEVLESCVLRPLKTIAFAVALGIGVPTPAQASSCDYCERRDLCRAR